MMPEKVDGSVVEAMLKLHPEDIPMHLMQNNPTRDPKDFDPNAYFTVLSHLGMRPGYTLDYLYHYTEHFDGYPCLYARPVDGKPFESFTERRDWEEFLVADGSPDSFFQLAVFHRLAGQFYLYWHANYNDLKIVTTYKEIEAIITDVNEKNFGVNFTDEQVADLRAIDPEPTVAMVENIAVVNYCIFTKWGGFARLKESFLKAPPHRLVDRDLVSQVKYDCQVVY